MKNTAKAMVRIKAYMPCCLFPTTIAWCAHVTEAPDERRITVFKKGISHGFKTSIPFGGHTAPISTVGAKLE